LLEQYIAPYPWLETGIHLILGEEADEAAMTRGHMFLPIELEKAFRNAKIDGRPLVKEEIELNPETLVVNNGFQLPLVVSILILGLSLFLFFKKRRVDKVSLIDKILFSVAGLIGWFFLFMWFGTEHIATAANSHIYWLIPLYVPLVWILEYETLRKWVFRPALILLAIYFLNNFVSNDVHPWPILLLALALGLRILYYVLKPKVAS